MASESSNKPGENKVLLFDVIKLNMAIEKDGTVIVANGVFTKYSQKQLVKVAKALLDERWHKNRVNVFMQEYGVKQSIQPIAAGQKLGKLLAQKIKEDDVRHETPWPFQEATYEPIEPIGVELEETKVPPAPTNLSEE